MATAEGSSQSQGLHSNYKINVRIHAPEKISPHYKTGEMLLTESVHPLLPVKDLFVGARRYAKYNFPFGRCDIVYRGMYVEQDATPFGLGMEDDEWVGVFPTFERGGLPFFKYLSEEAVFHMGPVRNGGSALPIRKMVPNKRESMEATVDSMVESWVLEARKEGFEVKDTPTFLLYKDKKLALGKNIKIKDAIDTRMQNHYFCIPPSTQDCSKEATSDRPSLDIENINRLVKSLRCIELGDEDANSAATGTKRKKKRQGQRQRQESEPEKGQVPEARQNPRVRHDPEANRVAVSRTPSNFNEHLVAGASQREAINMKKKKERACAKDQNKEEAESLFIDQVTSYPHLRLLFYKFLVMTMRLIPCCHYHYNAGGAASSIRQEGSQGD